MASENIESFCRIASDLGFTCARSLRTLIDRLEKWCWDGAESNYFAEILSLVGAAGPTGRVWRRLDVAAAVLEANEGRLPGSSAVEMTQDSAHTTARRSLRVSKCDCFCSLQFVGSVHDMYGARR